MSGLRITPTYLNQSVYVRIPINFAEMVGLEKGGSINGVRFNFEQTDQEYRLVYTVPKPRNSE